jgi:predicted transcriptional regulator
VMVAMRDMRASSWIGVRSLLEKTIRPVAIAGVRSR